MHVVIPNSKSINLKTKSNKTPILAQSSESDVSHSKNTQNQIMWPGHVIVGMFNGTNPMSYRFRLPNIDVPARGVTVLAVRLTVILISGRPGWVWRIELVPVVISLSQFQSTQSDAIDKFFRRNIFYVKWVHVIQTCMVYETITVPLLSIS